MERLDRSYQSKAADALRAENPMILGMVKAENQIAQRRGMPHPERLKVNAFNRDRRQRISP